mgnify:CR=1 FL=1
MYVCNNCGKGEKFTGYQHYKEWGTEGILVDENGEIIDYFDKEVDDSEREVEIIEKCGKCESEDIQNLTDESFEKWEKDHFDANGNFIKITKSPAEPDAFVSVNKLQLLNDKLLKNEISIEQYRRETQAIGKLEINIPK